ncbi:hypothetical protein Despr_1236 [Desulfobulbus propionicus DSM 2032]|jgi:hypothetical protein|uniref:DUF3313 domain-containing protein n=1 Tax=Desulfobulbus propionicus (strain ATCC 33891 / DSM 2032 / VKM B-1956 / 1pr3) TaxID=577650 RepID=A0A7U4DNT0_DESPD|nr:DUF3313 domain-containing protein [Desulfobulbus propionicus]ADW17401.1 hypothetical protein Despr_1236 [Desulfobulbus propionicus DSM 2032]
MKTTRTLMIGALLLVCGMLVGCASTPKETPSGFLQNYPQFQPGPSDGVDQLYTKPGMDLSKYRRIMVDEAQFYLKKSAAEQGIQASELKELSDTFHRAIFEALGNAYPLVTEPGADVLRIRLAVTNIETSNPAMSGITTVLPVGLAISVAKKATTGSYTGVGGASMEVEFLDSMTNERLAAAIDTFDGSKMSGFSKLGATKEAFAFWAKRLRVTLDKAHGKVEE